MANEMRLIYANDLYQKTFICDEVAEVRKFIEQAHTVDAVEVVRCKDCKHAEINDNHPNKPLICFKTRMCGTTIWKSTLMIIAAMEKGKTMTDEKLDLLMIRLQNAHERKKDIALAKANAEIETIRREHEAYWDGVYDAIKEVKAMCAREVKEA